MSCWRSEAAAVRLDDLEGLRDGGRLHRRERVREGGRSSRRTSGTASPPATWTATKPPFDANVFEKLPITMSILPSMFCRPMKPRPSSPMSRGRARRRPCSVASYSRQSSCSAARSGVSESIENRLSVTTRMPFSVSLARIVCRCRRADCDVEMTVQVDVPRRGVGAFLQAGMREPVHHDVIVRADEALDDAVAGGPSGRVEHRVLELEEPRDRLLELQRILRVAGKRRRAGAVDAVLVDDRPSPSP